MQQWPWPLLSSLKSDWATSCPHWITFSGWALNRMQTPCLPFSLSSKLNLTSHRLSCLASYPHPFLSLSLLCTTVCIFFQLTFFTKFSFYSSFQLHYIAALTSFYFLFPFPSILSLSPSLFEIAYLFWRREMNSSQVSQFLCWFLQINIWLHSGLNSKWELF